MQNDLVMKTLLTSTGTRVVLILVALLITLGHPRVSYAAGPIISGFHQFDFDSDGKPDSAIIECTCITGRDRILVFDGEDDMLSSADWKEGTDIENDTWVIDIGADGRANLIIQFQSAKGKQVARLYDDVDGDGTVAYHLEGKQVVINESPFWSLEVTARPGWFMENGQANLNINVLLDKPFPAGFEFLNEDFAQQYMPHDGRPDAEFEMVDNNHDGVAEYYLSKLLSVFPQRFTVGKSRLWFNAEGEQSMQPDSALFWPFLDLQPVTDAAKDSLRFFDLLPRVSIDWETSSINGFVLPGYPVEAGYWINSESSIEEGQVNDSSFETPHAWYDLAGDQDGIPELNIRLFMPIGQSRQEIRYSWNQLNSAKLVWDYKLGMMGNNPIDETVDLHNFSLRMIPYERLPYWVNEHEWELTTFVAREGEPRESSEGIYAWTPWSGADPTSPDNPSVEAYDAALSYVTGADLVPPYQYFNEIWEGFRGEYNFARPQKPILYFSPVDHRLHLKGAEHGLLNLGNTQYVMYDNKDGDDYLDQWSFIETGEIQRQLYVAKSHLIYSGENDMLLKRADIAPSLFETLPPRSHKEWLELGLNLEEYKRELAPDDFKGMVLQFDGPETQIEGATMKDFRFTKGGFRFVLELQPGFRVNGSEALNWNRLPPGAYVVTYNHSMSIEPLTPPAPSASLIDAHPIQLKLGHIPVTLRNDGLEDLSDVELQLWATSPEGNTSLVITQTVTLLAQTTITSALEWAPTTAGEWTLTPVIRQPDGHMIFGNPTQASVLQAQAANFGNLIPLSVHGKLLPFLIIGLISFAGIGSLVFFQAWKRSLSESEEKH